MGRAISPLKGLAVSLAFGLISFIFGCGFPFMESNSKADGKRSNVSESVSVGSIRIGDRPEVLMQLLGHPTSISKFKELKSGVIGEIHHYQVQSAQFRFRLTDGKYTHTIGAQFVILANEIWKIVPNPNPQRSQNSTVSHGAASTLRGTPGVVVSATLEWK
jgi:hypothetical protein